MRRTRLGLGAAVGAAVLALLVTGCSSGDAGNGGEDGQSGDDGASPSAGTDTGGKDDGGPDDGGPNGSTSQGQASGGGADTGGKGGDSGKQPDLSPYQGPWAAGMKSDAGRPMVLIFNEAEVSLAGPEIACQGTLKAAERPAKLELTCRDEGDDYASGTVTELNEKSLTVKWGSGEEKKFLKGAAPAGPPGE